MDSLGLGLTLDTTLLEKADKTLENMQKNSKLIMQNLTRGFTAFNEGKMGNFTKVFDDVSKAMDRISKAKVSPDFDTKGQEKYIDRMEHLLTIVEKMSKIDNAKFFDPTEVYVTDKDATDIFGDMQSLQEHKKEIEELVNIIKNFVPIQQGLKEEMGKLGEEITSQEKEVTALSSAYDEAKRKQEDALKAMAIQFKSFSTRERKKDSSLTDEQLLGMFTSRESMQKYVEEVTRANEELVKAEQKLMDSTEKLEGSQSRLNAAQREYKSNIEIKKREDEIKTSYDLIKEQEKILQSEMKYAQATQAERAAMLTKRNEAEIKADQKRIRDVQKSYETLRKEIQKGEKDIETLKYSGKQLKESGKSTKEITAEISNKKAELNKLMQVELEFRSGEYWPKLQAIDEKYRSEEFIKRQKEESKKEAKKSRKDVTAALLYSKNAQSINEEKEAIKRLMEARDNLSTSTARYKKTVEDINKRILAHKDHIDAVTRVEKEQNTLADSVINRYRKQLKALDDVNEALEKQMKIERKTNVADLDPTNADTQSLLARRKTIADDIADIESSAQGQLDVIREQHEAERAKKNIDSILKQNEREKQEYAKLLDEKYALEKQKKAMEDAGATVGDKAYDNILKQEQDLINRISQLKAKHRQDLDEIEKKHNKKRNDDDVKAFIEAQKEKQKIAEQTVKKMIEKTRKYGTISSASVDRLIDVTDNAKNINQHRTAIQKLEQARASLDNTDKNYYLTLKKIETALQRHHKELRLAGVESNNLMQSHRGLLNIGGQLARRLALVFSVSQLTQYFRKLVEVRGQFEKTEVALTSIIGDNQKAQKLMNQTIALAIKSPFTLQQLTSYTKQLAAYQVSYEELHSTTKMLADVSAGLGVEMDRLILAFGQVKAANYLRATEVRQFTEAGFNILGELAKYYNDLKGTMLSVGDVQEMVTKRMVDFADVEAVFHRVTEAGGMFFDMQSKQAETLAGQWTNLQDRIDVMLNEIGSDNDGLLKGLVSTLASLIDNWEAIADVLKIVIGAFALYKMNILAVTKAQITNSIAARAIIKEEIKMLGLTKGLSAAWKGLGLSVNFTNGAMKKFFTANAWMLALTAMLSVISSVISHFSKLNDAVGENTRTFSTNRSEAKKLAEEYGELNSALSETTDKEKKLAIIEEKRAKLQELSVKLRERGLKLTDSDGNIVDPKIIDATLLDKLFTYNKKTLDDAYKLGEELSESITRGLNAAQGNILGFSFFGENLQEDAEDLGQTYGKIASHTFSSYMDDVEANIHNNYEKLSRRSQTLYKELAEGRKAEKNENGEVVKWLESEYDWTKRRLYLLQQISFIDNKTLGVQLKLNNARANLFNSESEFSHELEGVLNKLIEKYGSIEALKKEYEKNPQVISAAIKTEIDKQSWDENVKWFAEQDLHAKLEIKYNYVEVVSSETPEKIYKGFKKDLIEARTNLEKAGEGYSNFFISTEDIDKMEQFTDGLNGLQKAYDDNIKKRESLKNTTTEEGKAELLMINAIIAEVERLAATWGYTLEAKGGKGKDERLERLKNQISLIKEMNKEYERLNKTFSKAESLEKVQKAYADTAKELGLNASTMDFTDEGTIKSLEALLGKPEYAANKYVIELQKALDNFKVELGIEVKQEKDQDLKAQVQKIFDQYDLSVELKKLNIPKDLAKSLFDVDYLDLDGLKKAVQDQEAKFIGTDMEDEYKKFLEKIDDLEDKQQLERLKKYIEYAKKGVSERAKIKLEELKKLQEIEETFKVKEGDSADVKAQKEDMSKRASEKVRKESQKAMNQLEWEEFEKSDTFINIFDDIDNASTTLLNHMIGRLEEFKEQWKDMPLEDVNKIIEKLNLLQDKLAKAKPSEAAKKARDEIKAARGQIEMEGVEKIEFEDKEAKELAKKRGKGGFFAAMDEEQAYQDQQKASAQEQISLLETALRIKEGMATASDKILQEDTQIKDMLNLSKDELKDQLKTQQGIVSNADKQNGKIQKARQNQKNLTAAQKAQYDAIKDSVDMANDLYSAFKELVEVLDADDPAMVFADMGMNILSSIPTMLALISQIRAATYAAEGLGVAMNMAMGIVGLIVMAIQLLVQAISAAVNYAEKMRQMKLDILANQVDNLKQKYDALAESIDKAYSTKQLQEYSKEMEKVQAKMEDAQRNYIKLLESGKDGDTIDIAKEAQKKLDAGLSVDDLSKKERKALLSEEYKDYKEATEALVEMQKDYEEQKKDMLDSMGGVTDYKSAAQEFVDAWVDAFQETGDGLSGLQENFREFFDNVIKQEAMRRVTDKYMKPFFDDLNAALESESSLSEGEIADLKAKADKVAPELSKVLEELWTALGGSRGETSGGLSALQKGISSISEQTAQVLEAYLNSVRMYVATISADTTSQLNEVKAIHRLLESVTRGGHPMGGAGFKVFMD